MLNFIPLEAADKLMRSYLILRYAVASRGLNFNHIVSSVELNKNDIVINHIDKEDSYNILDIIEGLKEELDRSFVVSITILTKIATTDQKEGLKKGIATLNLTKQGVHSMFLTTITACEKIKQFVDEKGGLEKVSTEEMLLEDCALRYEELDEKFIAINQEFEFCIDDIEVSSERIEEIIERLYLEEEEESEEYSSFDEEYI